MLALLVALLAGCSNSDSGASAGTSTVVTTAPTASQTFALQKVSVDGRSVALSCKGTGDKTVLFVSDIGLDAMAGWGKSKVPDLLADKAKVCIYDRPGLGESDPATAPRSITNQVSDLNGLVAAAGLKTPLYVVGQGYGTLIARQFAKDQRSQVAGMVLIDPPLWALELATPANASAGVKAEYDALGQLNSDLGLYGAGALPPPPAPTIVVGIDGSKPALPVDPTAAVPLEPTTTAAPLPSPDKQRDEQKQLAQKGPFGKFEYLDSAGAYAQYWSPEAVADAIQRVLANSTR